MDIRVIKRKNALEMQLAGKLDLDKAEKFESEFTVRTRNIPEKVIGISLTKLDFIDSSGLGSLIKALNLAKNQSKTLVLFGAPPKIQNIFSIARLEKFFTFHTSSEFNTKYPTLEDEEMDEMLNKL